MNTFGRKFRVSIFGESHGTCIGVTIDGVPSGMPLQESDFAEDILRRAPGAKGTTQRRETDRLQFLSGLFNGRTTGAPLTVIIPNMDANSPDYDQFRDIPRPGHADYSASVKYGGMNDPRGGGAFSGRLTLALVVAGTVAKKMLPQFSFSAELVEIAGLKDKSKWSKALSEAAAEGDSLGGIVECSVKSVPAGLGEPFWDSIESLISHAVFSIPGVRGIEFGDGFAAASMKGSEHNDPFGPQGPTKNGSGGVNGGITNGAPIRFRVAFKPSSSILRPQKTWNFLKEEESKLEIKGRHDVCFALRTPVIVEAVTAIVMADTYLLSK